MIPAALLITYGTPAGPQVFPPSSVLTTFTYTGQTPPAAESHLYDNDLTTDSADPLGLQTTTAAAYDLGSAKTVTSVRAVNSNRFIPAAPAVPAISTATGGQTSTAASQVAAVTANNGDFILLFLHRNFDGAGASGTVSTVTDAKGNTYTRYFRQQVDGTSHQTCEVWGAFNAGTSGTFNITAVWSGSGTAGAAITASYSGVNPVQPIRNVSSATVNDSDTVVSPMSVSLPVSATYSRLIEFEASNEDLGSSPSGYANVASSSTGTGSSRTCLTANSIAGDATTGPHSISVAGNNRRAIMAALELQTLVIIYKVQYSDTSLSAGWTDAGATLNMPDILSADISTTIGAVGAHRYWRITYAFGPTGQNAWLAELQFIG